MFTPGPWVIYKCRDGLGHEMLSLDREIRPGVLQEICRSYDVDKDSMSNFYLLSTSIELLDALEGMFGLVETLSNLVADPMEVLRRGGGYKTAKKARLIIAKAKGESYGR